MNLYNNEDFENKIFNIKVDDLKYESEILNEEYYCIKKEKNIKCENGNKYIGEIFNNKKNGEGIMYYANGDIYEGEWKNDMCEGFGVYITCFISDEKITNRYKYEGMWKNNRRHGKGKITDLNDVILYDGNFIYDIREEMINAKVERNFFHDPMME